MRCALLLFVSGCLEPADIGFDPDPRARTTLLINERHGWVIDHDQAGRPDVPLNLGRGERLFALEYSQPIASLQVEAGVIHPDPIGDRDLPVPDLRGRVRAAPIEDNDWTDTAELPEFELPSYVYERCVEDGLCLPDPDGICQTCTSTVPPLKIAQPEEPSVDEVPPHQRCDPGSAHFFDGLGCEPVTRPCTVAPPGAIADRDALANALVGTATSVVLAPGLRITSPAIVVNGPKIVDGCGSTIALDENTVLTVGTGTVTFTNLRIEGGHVGIGVEPAGTAVVDGVAFDGTGVNAIYSRGSLHARNVSVEGRLYGIQAIGGRAIIDRSAVRDAEVEGVSCHLAQLRIRRLVIHGTPRNDTGRGILVTNRCDFAMEEALLENGRRIAIETFDPGTSVAISKLTVRNIAGAPNDLSGAIVDRGSASGAGARYRLIDQVWIEDVYIAGIWTTDPNAHVRDVHVERINGNSFLPATAVKLTTNSTGSATFERIAIREVLGMGLVLEKGSYTPRTFAMVRDISVEGIGSEMPQVIISSVDVDMRNTKIAGGNDGLLIYDGSMAAIDTVSIESSSRYGINLEAAYDTILTASNVTIKGCNDGLRAALEVGDPGEQPRHLVAEGLSIADCVQYAVLLQGVDVGIDRFLLEANGVGIGIGEMTAFDLTDGQIRGNALGARIAPGYDPRLLIRSVRFFENVRALELMQP